MGDKCLFCDNDRMLIHGCTKRRRLVCEKHMAIKCPKCGHMALWTEQKSDSQYYVCFNDRCDFIKYVQTAATC